MKRLLLAALLLATPALAQDDMEAKLEAARAYVQSPAQQVIIEGIASPETVAAQLTASFPEMTPEQVELASRISAEELEPMLQQMEEAMIESVAEVFTLEEIEAITAFYETPEGLALATKTGSLMQASFSRIGPQMQAAQQRIAQRLSEAMQQPQ